MVEYVLLAAVIAGFSIVAIRVLTAGASDEVATQSICVSQRPQPPSCSAAAVDATSTTAAPVSSSSTTTTAPSAATTTTTAPPTTTMTAAPTTTTTAAPTTTSTTTAAPGGASGAFSSTRSNCTANNNNGKCSRWSASTTIKITRNGSPVANADVVATLSSGGTATCRTQSDGTCTLQVTGLSWNSVGTVTFTLSTVNGAAPTSTPSTKADRP